MLSQVVLSSGFCVLAGDLGAQLALRPLQNRSADASVASLDAWLEGYNGGVSAGVIHTAEAMKNASFPKVWIRGIAILVAGVLLLVARASLLQILRIGSDTQ